MFRPLSIAVLREYVYLKTNTALLHSLSVVNGKIYTVDPGYNDIG
jgi:hypothetical protein